MKQKRCLKKSTNGTMKRPNEARSRRESDSEPVSMTLFHKIKAIFHKFWQSTVSICSCFN